MIITKEKFKIGDKEFETTKMDTRIEIKKSIGQSLYDQSKLKMDNGKVIEK